MSENEAEGLGILLFDTADGDWLDDELMLEKQECLGTV